MFPKNEKKEIKIITYHYLHIQIFKKDLNLALDSLKDSHILR